MHEGGIGHQILEQVLRLARAQGLTQVSSVHVRLGGLRPVEPESVVFHFAHEAEGTLAQGARLECELVPPRAKCRSCGEVVTDLGARCPRCGSDNLEAMVAPEVEVAGIETPAAVVEYQGGVE